MPPPSDVPLYVPPPPEGCARTGPIEAAESDPTCVAARADDTTMREAMKHLAFDLTPDAETVTAGTMVIVRLSITNTSKSEVALLLDAQPPSSSPRPDWSRLSGVPEPKPASSGGPPPPDVYRLLMPMRTLDTHEHSVDGLPTTAASNANANALRALRIRLRGGGKLTHIFTWWALRIPTPDPVFYDDAGLRHVPKTAPGPIAAGEYIVTVELPLHGISTPESTLRTHVEVTKPDRGP
jgi:hypothetical protein